MAAYAAFATVLIAMVVQFQHRTRRNHLSVETFERLRAEGKIPPHRRPPKGHQGAIGRWRRATVQFWDGHNIYYRQPAPNSNEPKPPPPHKPVRNRVHMHPNMPFVVLLLTPFMALPPMAAALAFNALKVLVLLAALLGAASLAGHRGRKIPDWVVGLALLWSALMIVGDIQHGNTNIFVLGAIVLHLWLYRRGQDIPAGAALAVAICLKLTPALFLVYWLYQRNRRLLVATVLCLVLLAVIIPGAVLGPERFVDLAATWGRNLVLPGLLRGAWYPVHLNQSISGVASRYFLTGRNGDIFFDPDASHYDLKAQHGWITLVALPPAAVKAIVRILQVLVLAAMALAIGWRKLPRDDGRRLLHYGLVVLGMLLLNQRTWDHHAVVLVLAHLAVWQAIGFSRASRVARVWARRLMFAAGALRWLTGTDTFKGVARALGHNRSVGGDWADLCKAYGPTFWHFVLVLIAALILMAGLAARECPFASERQKFRA